MYNVDVETFIFRSGTPIFRFQWGIYNLTNLGKTTCQTTCMYKPSDLKSIRISKNGFRSLFFNLFLFLFLNQYNRSPPAARKSLNNHSGASSSVTSPTASTPTNAHTLSPQSGQQSSRNRSRSPTPHASVKNPSSPSTTEQLQVKKCYFFKFFFSLRRLL